VRNPPRPAASRGTPGRLASLLLVGLTLLLVACGNGTSASIVAPSTATIQATATTGATATASPSPLATVEPAATAASSSPASPAIPSPSPDAARGALTNAPAATPTATATVAPTATPAAPTATPQAPTATPKAPAPTATQAKADPAYYTEYFRQRGWTVLGTPLVAEVTGDGATATLYISYGQGCGSCHMQMVTVFAGRAVLFEQGNYAEPTLAVLPDRSGFVIEEHFPGATESWGNATGWRRHKLQWQGASFVETDRSEYIPPAATATPQRTPTAAASSASCCKLTFSVVLPNGSPATALSISAVAEIADQQGKFTGATQCPKAGCTGLPSSFDFALPPGWQGRITITVPGYKPAVYNLMVQSSKATTVTLVPAQ
jgi:hypothetical protein